MATTSWSNHLLSDPRIEEPTNPKPRLLKIQGTSSAMPQAICCAAHRSSWWHCRPPRLAAGVTPPIVITTRGAIRNGLDKPAFANQQERIPFLGPLAMASVPIPSRPLSRSRRPGPWSVFPGPSVSCAPSSVPAQPASVEASVYFDTKAIS